MLDTYLPLCPLKARLFHYNWITIASDCVRYNYLQVIIFCERKVLCIAADIDNTHSILAKMFGEKREHKFPSTILPTIIYQLSEENQNEKPILNSSIQVPAAKYASPCSRDFYFYFIFHLFKTVRHIVLTSICSFQISNDLLYPILCGKIDKEKKNQENTTKTTMDDIYVSGDRFSPKNSFSLHTLSLRNTWNTTLLSHLYDTTDSGWGLAVQTSHVCNNNVYILFVAYVLTLICIFFTLYFLRL